MLTRRHFIRTSSALFSAPLAGAVWAQSDEAVDAVTTDTAVEEPPARKPISDPAAAEARSRSPVESWIMPSRSAMIRA